MSEQPGVWTGPTEAVPTQAAWAPAVTDTSALTKSPKDSAFRVPNGNRVVLFQIEQVPDCQVASA